MSMTCDADAQSPPSGDAPVLVPAKAAVQETSQDMAANDMGPAGDLTVESRNENELGMSFLKNLVADQKAIWSSPAHLRWDDATWLFPLTTATAILFSTDRAVPPALSTDPAKLNRYTSFSNYGLYSMAGAGGGIYLWSRFISHDDRQRETGILATEAAVNSLAMDTALKYSFGRARPYEDQGRGKFFQGGDSFPSDHSAMAWSIASVIAHEYPSPLTKIAVYGLATAISATRVAGAQHFPSDVLVGGAIGWLIGWQVYRTHHDPEVGGSGWEPLSGNDDTEDHRDRHKMGSTFVPLDSWVYDALERLVGLGLVHTAIMGLKPWTRIECARLTEDAGEALGQGSALNEEAAQLQSRLEREFGREIELLSGGRNLSANLDSVYARAVSISGPPLTDGYHFGQTIAYDYGRPFERGTNGQVGGSFSATAGPLAFYVRAEVQHAPAAPAPASEVVSVISMRDGVAASQIPSGPVNAIDRVSLLDAYALVNLNNWQLTIGNQSLSWAPGPDSMMWTNNIEPVHMVRLVNPEPFYLPGFLSHLGPVRVDQFVGRLEGDSYIRRPFVFGQKINLKLFPFLELGFGRRTTLGGEGGDPVTFRNVLHAFIGKQLPGNVSVPGDSESEMDWTFYVPRVRKYIVLYGDAYAEDDVLPLENPARNPWHPGVYLTRIPGIPKLDFHIEGVSTEQNGIVGGGNGGYFNYWNSTYRDGNTNGRNLIGNTVGREGRAIRLWFTYWISPQDSLQVLYKHSTVSSDFIPGGGNWQDYGLKNEMQLHGGMYVKTELQYERISRYPLLFSGPQANFSAILEIGFSPERKK